MEKETIFELLLKVGETKCRLWIEILEGPTQGGGVGRVRKFASVFYTVTLWRNEGLSWSKIVQAFWRQDDWRRFPYELTPSTLVQLLNI